MTCMPNYTWGCYQTTKIPAILWKKCDSSEYGLLLIIVKPEIHSWYDVGRLDNLITNFKQIQLLMPGFDSTFILIRVFAHFANLFSHQSHNMLQVCNT